jgi:hypothetical protein
VTSRRHTHNIARASPFRGRIAGVLRKYADRIDHAGAPKATHVRFTFEDRVGIVFRDDGKGCRLWYYGDEDYERAHDEAGPVLGANSTAWLPQRRPGRTPAASPSPTGTVITLTAVPPYTPPAPFPMSPEAIHLARYCTGSGCRSPLHRR